MQQHLRPQKLSIREKPRLVNACVRLLGFMDPFRVLQILGFWEWFSS